MDLDTDLAISRPIVVTACTFWLLRIVVTSTATTSLALACRWRSRPQHQNRNFQAYHVSGDAAGIAPAPRRKSVTSSENHLRRPSFNTPSEPSGSGCAVGMPCATSASAQPSQFPPSTGSLHEAHD